MEEIFSVQTLLGTEWEAEGRRKRSCLLGLELDTEMGPEHRAHQEDGVREEEVSSGGRGGGGLAEQALRLGLQIQGSQRGGSGCVEGSRGQGTREPERGLKGLMQPVVASLIFSVSVVASLWIYMCSLS